MMNDYDYDNHDNDADDRYDDGEIKGEIEHGYDDDGVDDDDDVDDEK